MTWRGWLAGSIALLGACGGEAVIDGDPSRGGAGAQGGAGGGATCSAFTGQTCGPDELCDYEPDTCGATDGSGICRPRPTGCDKNFDPTCGCDGVVHDNECVAQSAGTDANELGGCPPPPALFGCGSHFCQLATHYCSIVHDDTGLPPSYACQPLPLCGGSPSCGCLAMLPCGEFCEGDATSGLTLSCPGG